MTHRENNQSFQKLQTDSLLALVKEHKATCKGDCDISLFALFLVYRNLMGEGGVKEFEQFL